MLLRERTRSIDVGEVGAPRVYRKTKNGINLSVLGDAVQLSDSIAQSVTRITWDCKQEELLCLLVSNRARTLHIFLALCRRKETAHALCLHAFNPAFQRHRQKFRLRTAGECVLVLRSSVPPSHQSCSSLNFPPLAASECVSRLLHVH